MAHRGPNDRRTGFLFVMSVGAVICPAQTVIQHEGAADPIDEGFVTESSGVVTVGPIVGDMGFDAWKLSATGLIRYQSGDLTPAQKAAALSEGWKITLIARVAFAPDLRGLVTSNVENLGGLRFDINLGLDANGDTFVRLNENILPGLNAIGPTYGLEGSGSTYHKYELVYDASLQTADLFVDGVERISDYPGHNHFVREIGYYMGVYQGYVGHYTLARFEIGPGRDDVPGDGDGDGDVDLADYAAYVACVTGPAAPQLPPACAAFDLDGDADVDKADLAAFQVAFTGQP